MAVPAGEIITTNRLVLRGYNPDICNHLFTISDDSEIMNYLGLKSGEELRVEKERFVGGYTTFNKSFLYFHLILKENNMLIGWCGFHTVYSSHDRAELGYVMNGDEHKGKGYMKEALRPVLQFGFEKMKLNRVEAFISEENIPSFKLLISNNFQKEGLLREHYFTKGKHEDSAVYSLLKSDFR